MIETVIESVIGGMLGSIVVMLCRHYIERTPAQRALAEKRRVLERRRSLELHHAGWGKPVDALQLLELADEERMEAELEKESRNV